MDLERRPSSPQVLRAIGHLRSVGRVEPPRPCRPGGAGRRARGTPRGLTARPLPFRGHGRPPGTVRWRPEPQLIGIRDEPTSRAALERVGEATWRASLDWLYDEAMAPRHGPAHRLRLLRRLYFGRRAAARAWLPRTPTTLGAVIEEFTARIAPHTLNSYHPRALLRTSRLLRSSRPSRARCSPSGPTRASTSGTRARVAPSWRKRSLRWLCDLFGLPETSFGPCARAVCWPTSPA